MKLLEEAGYRFVLRHEEGPAQEQLLWVTKPAERDLRAAMCSSGAWSGQHRGVRVPFAGRMTTRPHANKAHREVRVRYEATVA